jgi:hypothetical protein
MIAGIRAKTRTQVNQNAKQETRLERLRKITKGKNHCANATPTY